MEDLEENRKSWLLTSTQGQMLTDDQERGLLSALT
jgi:hypothetical protein